MNFDELCEATVTWTNKPELVAETRLAVQRATLMAHLQENWRDDFRETIITLATEDYIFQIPKAEFARFNQVEYFRKWDPNGLNQLTSAYTGAGGEIFQEIDPNAIFDSYDQERPNVYYLAGSAFQFRSDTQIQYVLVGWYQNPVISPMAQYSSWIADAYPNVIYDQAAAIIMGLLGDQERMKTLSGMAAASLEQMRASSLYTQAR